MWKYKTNKCVLNIKEKTEPVKSESARQINMNWIFRKRQNLYYVKVQERLSTLDAGQDYIMTVTSISGNIKVG